MKFDEYIVEWFRTIVETATTEQVEQLYNFMHAEHEDYKCNTIDKMREYLMYFESGIYENVFSDKAKKKGLWLAEKQEEFLTDAFTQAALKVVKHYDFVDELVEDMVGECIGYGNPIGFFEDLEQGGCKSGMVGMFIYHSDCKKFYICHIDDMESFVEDWNEKIGEPIINKDKQPHYTFICWVCYEALAYYIADVLWPNRF